MTEMDPSKFGARDSLVRQASIDRFQNEGVRRCSTLKHRKELEQQLHAVRILRELNDEGVELIWSSKDDMSMMFSAILTGQKDDGEFLFSVLSAFHAFGIGIRHMETRPQVDRKDSYVIAEEVDQTTNRNVPLEILVGCDCTKKEFIDAIVKLTESDKLKALKLFKNDNNANNGSWFPRHIAELDKCFHCIIKYEPTTDPRHPGYGDAEYIERRTKLNAIAKAYKHGEPLPEIEYTEAEHKTWETVYLKLKSLHATHSCAEYQRNFAQMEKDGIFVSNRIPNLAEVNEYLQKKTGFLLRPCGGLLSARDFLASLAFRVFQTTLYVRHTGSPHHSPEPDLIHEFLGHCPMFADPTLAQFSQEIGLLSLGATDQEIEQLATVYWFIIEFGLCRQEGRYKAIGAGLLSSYGELMHSCSETPEHRVFDPETTALQKYEDADYQPLYFVAESITDAMIKLRRYARTIKRSFSVVYDPFTRSVEVIRRAQDLASTIERFKADISTVINAVEAVCNDVHRVDKRDSIVP